MIRGEVLRLRLLGWWMIAKMYAIIFWQALTSPAVVVKYAVGSETLREEIERKIDLMVLSERDRKILKRRVLDGVKFEALAEEFELSERTVRTICSKYKSITE